MESYSPHEVFEHHSTEEPILLAEKGYCPACNVILEYRWGPDLAVCPLCDFKSERKRESK